MSVVRTLQERIFDITGGLFATWMPDDRVAIGDYGEFSKGRLWRHGNLKNKGFNIERHQQKGKKSSFNYSGGVKKSPHASGKGSDTTLGSGSFDLEFTKEGSFIYHSKGTKYLKINNKDDIITRLIMKITTGELMWKDSYVLVDEAVHCDHSTILISEATSGFVNVSADTKLGDEVNLAELGGGIGLSVSSGSFLDYSAEENSNPLFHPIRLKFPDDPGGGGFGQAVSNIIGRILGVAYPKPAELDVSAYGSGGNAFVLKYLPENTTTMILIEDVGLEEIFFDDPNSSSLEDPAQFAELEKSIETIMLEPKEMKRSQSG